MSDILEEKTEQLKKLRAGDLKPAEKLSETPKEDAVTEPTAPKSGGIVFRAPEGKDKKKRKGKTAKPVKEKEITKTAVSDKEQEQQPAAETKAEPEKITETPAAPDAEATVKAEQPEHPPEKTKGGETEPSNMKTVTVSVPTAALVPLKEEDKTEEPPKKRAASGLRMSGSFAALACACFILVCAFASLAIWMGLLGKPTYTPASGTASLLSDPGAHKTSAAIELLQNDVLLRVSSVEEDLSIQFTNLKGELITGIPFKASLADKDGGETLCEDDDMDGEIYLEDVAAGSYTVKLVELPDGYAEPAAVTATVAAKIEYKPVPVVVVSAKSVNAEEDDPTLNKPKPQEPVVTVPQNTVDYVESKTEKKKETVETVTGYNFTPELSNGYLIKADGTVSDIVAELDADGYLIGGHTVTAAPTEPPLQEPPAETPPEETPAAETPAEEAPTSEAPEAPAATTASTTQTAPTTTPVELFDNGDPKDMLKDSTGNYYYKVTKTEIKTSTEKEVTVYYGWQTVDGKKYFYDKNGKKVIGTQVILNVTYIFGSDGVLQTANTPVTGRTLGIDVSTWQDRIDWAKVKASGVDYVMIRCGFRGYGSGKIVEDDMFRTNIVGAKNAGLKVGVYFYTAALNTQEAVEEASAVIQIIRGYGINYPVAFDCEVIGGGTSRSNAFDYMSRAERTKICIAFCETIRSAGYTPMVYSFKSWLENAMDTSQFSPYKIWVAHVTSASRTSYAGRYDMWQYTFHGTVPGISGRVDMNWSYLGY